MATAADPTPAPLVAAWILVDHPDLHVLRLDRGSIDLCADEASVGAHRDRLEEALTEARFATWTLSTRP